MLAEYILKLNLRTVQWNKRTEENIICSFDLGNKVICGAVNEFEKSREKQLELRYNLRIHEHVNFELSIMHPKAKKVIEYINMQFRSEANTRIINLGILKI